MRRTLFTLVFITTWNMALADDWPQWLGPARDGVWREDGVIERFPEGGPSALWRVEIGAGYTGPAVVGGRVYVMDREVAVAREDEKSSRSQGILPGSERVVCLDAKDGRIIWEHRYDCTYTMAYSTGPRCTPLVSNGKVWTLGAEGNLFCLDAVSGAVLWSRDFKRDFGARTPMWGFAGHPLLVGQALICLCGGPGSVVVAFDKDSGAVLWRGLDAREPGYAPPTLIEHDGVRQIILWHAQAVNSLDPDTGTVLWSHPWDLRSGLSIPTPRLAGDFLFLTAFYNGSKCFRLRGASPPGEPVWQSRSITEKNTDTLNSIMSTPFIEDGHIYGVCSYGQLRCLRLETGERLWETFAATTDGEPVRWANAFIIKHENRFFLANEKGELILANLSPGGYAELGRFKMLEPTTIDPRRPVLWSHPAFANRSVYARNDRELVCYSLARD